MTFKSELCEVSKLVRILETEQYFLVNRNLYQIQVIDQERSNVLHKISTYSERRYRWLAKAGYSPSESGMCDWFIAIDEPSAQDAWFDMQRLLVKAKVLNLANVLLTNRLAEAKQKIAEGMLVAG